MRKVSLLFCLLFTVLLVGCVSSEKRDVDSFANIKIVNEYDSIYSDTNDQLGRITDIRVFNNLLVSKHMNDQFSFSFIDINEGKLICRWGKKGEGPEEFIQIGGGFTINNSSLVFLETGKKEIISVLIDSIIKQNNSSAIINRESYPYTVDFRPRRIEMVGDKKILAGAFKEGSFGLLDSDNKIVPTKSEYPFNHGQVDGIYRGTVFQSDIKSNSKSNKFTLLTFSSDVFEIYTVQNSLVERQFLSTFQHAPQIEKKGDRYAIDPSKSIVGLMNLSVSDNYICFTYSSKTVGEASLTEYTSDIVLCYDWEGRKVMKYILPFPISNLCIDDTHMYGIRYLDDGLSIYRFRF